MLKKSSGVIRHKLPKVGKKFQVFEKLPKYQKKTHHKISTKKTFNKWLGL